MHTFNCEMSLACTYAIRKPEIARNCAARAFFAALTLGRPDLMYQANSLMGAL
jgi:hypothetical protein